MWVVVRGIFNVFKEVLSDNNCVNRKDDYEKLQSFIVTNDRY